MSNRRTYLNVPHHEKNHAKYLGAKWNARERKWYEREPELIERWGTRSEKELSRKTRNYHLDMDFLSNRLGRKKKRKISFNQNTIIKTEQTRITFQ